MRATTADYAATAERLAEFWDDANALIVRSGQQNAKLIVLLRLIAVELRAAREWRESEPRE